MERNFMDPLKQNLFAIGEIVVAIFISRIFVYLLNFAEIQVELNYGTNIAIIGIFLIVIDIIVKLYNHLVVEERKIITKLFTFPTLLIGIILLVFGSIDIVDPAFGKCGKLRDHVPVHLEGTYLDIELKGRDGCFWNKSLQHSDIRLCEYVSDEFWKAECIGNVVNLIGSTNSCKDLTNEDDESFCNRSLNSYSTIGECELYDDKKIIKLQNSELNELFTVKDVCYMKRAEHSASSEFCQSISNENLQRYCLKKLQVSDINNN